VCSQFTFGFAHVSPIPHSTQKKQAADTVHLYLPHFSENRLTYLHNQPPSVSAGYDTAVASAAIVPVFVAD